MRESVSRARSVLGVLVTALAVGTSLLSSLYVFAAESYVPNSEGLDVTWRPALGFVAALAAAVLLCWRHTRPVVVTGVSIAGPLVFVTDALAALISLAALTAHRRDRVGWLGVAAVFAATTAGVAHDAHRHADVSIIKILFGAEGVPFVVVVLIAALLTAVPAGIGVYRGTKRELARHTNAERALQAEMARKDERSRIAREMHDVLGHRLSLLSLHAGALEVTAQQESGRAAEVARTVRTTARQSLEDLRQVIGVLRDGRGFVSLGHEQSSRPGPPGLTDLPTLIGNTRDAGLPVNVTVLVDDAAAAPEPLATTTYRVVQESLTNVLKHAPSTTVDVTVRGGPGVGLTVEIRNPLPVSAPAEAPIGSGSGLAGLAERVTRLEGTISYGPTEQGHFAVKAWLPWEHGEARSV
ncbi:sensor histidine kinase [Saccharomonospora xinjiangensis]|uniref:sensor histidine kinase n=1 Tax=Saccharomonospora xinjiangensis TaxID=75294 RepID=UPI001FFD171D|nr:histidine kinase [Saccharomonospora xinjiangensis]